MKTCKEPSDFVKLAGTIGGILLTIIVLVLIFAKDQIVPIIPLIAWPFVVLGIVLGMFQLKSQKK